MLTQLIWLGADYKLLVLASAVITVERLKG